MKKEYFAVASAGLIVLGYILDALVNSLPPTFPTPYHFFALSNFSLYPFTTTSILIKGLGLFIATIYLLSLSEMNHLVKGTILLVLSALAQLYTLQDVVSQSYVLPLEWSLSITFTGMLLLLPTIYYFVSGATGDLMRKLFKDPYDTSGL